MTQALSQARSASIEDLDLDPKKVQALLARVRVEVDEGLLPAAQIAIARHGKVGVFESFGTAQPESLTAIFSATKGITSAAAWLLFQEGALGEDERVVDIIPEFGSNDKGSDHGPAAFYAYRRISARAICAFAMAIAGGTSSAFCSVAPNLAAGLQIRISPIFIDVGDRRTD